MKFILKEEIDKSKSLRWKEESYLEMMNEATNYL